MPPSWRGVGAEKPWPIAWGEARRTLAEKTTTPSPPAPRAPWGGRTVFHEAKHARVARHGIQTLWQRRTEAAVADLKRCRCRRPSANGVEWSAACWPRRRPRQVRQRARAPWAVGRFSTGRRVRGPRGTGFGSCSHEVHIPLPLYWRSVGVEKPRPMAWGGARRALAEKATTPSPPARAGPLGSQTDFHEPKRARAARQGIQTLWPRGTEAAVADLAWCRCGSFSPNGVGWSAPRIVSGFGEAARPAGQQSRAPHRGQHAANHRE